MPDEIKNLQVNFKGPVTDVCWNNKYHVIAVCGFGKEFPILLYCWEASTEALGYNIGGFDDESYSDSGRTYSGSDSGYSRSRTDTDGGRDSDYSGGRKKRKRKSKKK